MCACVCVCLGVFAMGIVSFQAVGWSLGEGMEYVMLCEM